MDLIFNFIAALLGAFIGGLMAIGAVRKAHVLQCEADLRKLLIAQRMGVRMAGTIEAPKRQRVDFEKVLQAYENLRSACSWWKRKQLNAAWQAYKGNDDEFMPVLGPITIRRGEDGSVGATSREFDREEIMANLDRLLGCLKY